MEWPADGWTLEEVADLVGGIAQGSDGRRYLRPVPADEPDPYGIAFVESQAYLESARASRVGALVLAATPGFAVPHIVVGQPRAAFLRLLQAYAKDDAPEPGIHPSAVVAPTASLGPGVAVGPAAYVAEGAAVGAGSRLSAGCYIGPRCVVGEGCEIGPRAVLVSDVTTGARCRIQAGAVLGAAGFGYVWDGHAHRPVPQVGGVVLGDDVEVGACACIDRATCGDTRVGDGTKIDNLVQVGHNARIGRNVVLAGQTGLSGSVTLGDGVVAGGQVAFADHVRVASGARIAGRSGVTKSLPEPGDYYGMPARPAADALRTEALVRRLAGLVRRVEELEARLKDEGND